MPWCQEAKKGVVSCDKPRGAANMLRSGDSRIGQPTASNVAVFITEFIGYGGYTQGTETS